VGNYIYSECGLRDKTPDPADREVSRAANRLQYDFSLSTQGFLNGMNVKLLTEVVEDGTSVLCGTGL
jgi:hypothetical protein